MATLTAKNLAKAYKGRRVVEDVSLTVNSGEIVGLLGPNGAGKTTTFYMVVGIVRAMRATSSSMTKTSACYRCMRAPSRHRLFTAGSLYFSSSERV